MAVPVLLVTGFLGAGKTTLVNHLLAHAEGRRIAAVVNDFGAINIDAELIAGAADGVVSLANGCICCSLEGDLLRTLAAILRRRPRPELIVIETSGVADPAEIVRNLMDPVVAREAPLETVLCVFDASQADAPDDTLQRAQLRAADIVALSKLDLADDSARDRIRAAIAAINSRAVLVDAVKGEVPLDLLSPPDPAGTMRSPPVGRTGPRADRFETASWVSDRPLVLSRLQAAIGRLAPRLLRAKGFIETVEHPHCPLLLQFAGGRATLSPAEPPGTGAPAARIVFVTEIGALSAAEISAAMEDCIRG